MLDKIWIIDFEDSFTYNIANVLDKYPFSVKVVGHEDFFSYFYEDVSHSKERHAVILGPGPGHPEEYRRYFQQIERLKEKKNIYLMGICLGHQMLALINGERVDHAKQKIHGQGHAIVFKGESFKVQRYNSLAVWRGAEEVDIINYERGISYQFHPESIGTSDNDVFFSELIAFLE